MLDKSSIIIMTTEHTFSLIASVLDNIMSNEHKQ